MPSDLNRELLATYADMDGARERLTEFTYPAYIWILLERVMKEAQRLDLGEALRTKRDAT